MRRREFIAGLGAAAAFSRTAHGQQSTAVIGILGSSALDDYQPMLAAFRNGLSEAGYVQGKNVSFEHAWANDQYDRLPALASGLVGHRVSVILAASTPSVPLARSIRCRAGRTLALGFSPHLRRLPWST